MIEKREKIPLFLQRLKIQGKELNNRASLWHYEIEEGSILSLDLYYHDDEIEIFFETVTKVRKTLKVKTMDTIQNVKDKIQMEEWVSFDEYYLSFNKQKLDDKKTLLYYKIWENSIVYPENIFMQIFIKRTYAKTLTLKIRHTDTIKIIKTKIEDKIGISPKNQCLILLGKVNKLEDEKTASYYNIQKDSNLYLHLVQQKKVFSSLE